MRPLRAATGFLFLAALACAPVPPGQLLTRQRAALQQGDLGVAVRLGRARVEAAPEDVPSRYDLACALARDGQAEAALEQLTRAVRLGFDDVAWLRLDEDLAALRGHPGFAAVFEEVRRVSREGLEVPGTAVVVRDDLPTPMRVRVSPQGRRLRLAVWLHPAGARLDHELERQAPRLARHGWALAVPLAPRLDGWTDAEVARLLDDTVPRLGQVADVSRPLLLGLSAGAQAALVAWSTRPGRFQGVVAAGAPPDLEGHPLPGPGASPLVLLWGEHDPLAQAWAPLLRDWKARGLTLTSWLVPGRGHADVLDAEELERALEALPP
jgi:pimeloyl-ACP methyl ester carboxylesterase